MLDIKKLRVQFQEILATCTVESIDAWLVEQNARELEERCLSGELVSIISEVTSSVIPGKIFNTEFDGVAGNTQFALAA